LTLKDVDKSKKPQLGCVRKAYLMYVFPTDLQKSEGGEMLARQRGSLQGENAHQKRGKADPAAVMVRAEKSRGGLSGNTSVGTCGASAAVEFQGGTTDDPKMSAWFKGQKKDRKPQAL